LSSEALLDAPSCPTGGSNGVCSVVLWAVGSASKSICPRFSVANNDALYRAYSTMDSKATIMPTTPIMLHSSLKRRTALAMDISCLSESKTAMLNEELCLTTSKRLAMLMRPRIGILRIASIGFVMSKPGSGRYVRIEDSSVMAKGRSNRAELGIKTYESSQDVKQCLSFTWATRDRYENAKLDAHIQATPRQSSTTNPPEAITTPATTTNMMKAMYKFGRSTPIRMPPTNEVTNVVHFRMQMRETEIRGYAALDVATSAAVPTLNGSTIWQRKERRFSGDNSGSGALVMQSWMRNDTAKLKTVRHRG